MTSGGAMKVYVAIMAGMYFAPRWVREREQCWSVNGKASWKG